ncbi:cell envelope integrity protein TolA [Escherichia coli]|uniref:cell envelope integrity protein TolA n=2 Tax=Escherichia coli TaxID=562 RepID=UPI00092DAAEB|nr:cell envelope integrity protein TolA [Escherichia coli]APL03454.1 cell envelope protein TolA [Escherichia coli]APL13238.1 cell envelope protein TolA [Escherichia coli]APL22521.1 cell envelope protein TolA [Escherichia coli]APL28300.1 cell envelope protein TolA [Escherichia coli]APL37372.1 cell envelope protein TolA [Escherichia coli]
MGFRSASTLTLIAGGIIVGCTDAVSTNYYDRASYYSDKSTETQYVSSSERTTDVSEDIRQYAHQIKNAIEKQFGDASKYSGKECTLSMHMAPNGLLLEVKRESGDLDLCREAMNAIKNADIPAPPSPEVYKVFHNGVLDFKP